METKLIHRFEEAGLGVAPFTLHMVMMQDWSTCDYCGTAIKEHCYIKDCTGKVFLVGNECVKHTGDAGLISNVKVAVSKLRTEMRHKREQRKIDTAKAILASFESVKAELLVRFTYKEDFWNDFVLDRMRYGGTSYKLELSKKITDVAEEVLTDAEKQSLSDNFDTLFGNVAKAIEAWKAADKEKIRLMNEANDARLAAIKEANSDLLQVLGLNNPSPFIKDMMWKLERSEITSFSMRQVEVLSDIYAKHFGRNGTKEYQEAYRKIYERKMV